ncbi:hypothetical protein R5R35_011261 [Gryllus longicercus]|uniref:DDE Tnp4 domain-containing protein n=1 Tax=Gryllus longicercus TaxID=2509291 RepID=A0AAN9VZU9_9ORTH
MPYPTIQMHGRAADEFKRKWDFPNCVGCVDGKHIRIKCPPNSGSMLFNYKQFFSTHLLAIVDASYKFIVIDTGAYGRFSDSGAFFSSIVGKNLERREVCFNMPHPKPLVPGGERIPLVINADQGYPLKKYLMRPYPVRNRTREQQVSITD